MSARSRRSATPGAGLSSVVGVTAALIGGLGLGRWSSRSSAGAAPSPPPVPVPGSKVPETVALYYDETRDAHAHLLEVIGRYRANTTTVLAIATGATAFFGFGAGGKGLWFYLALAAYAAAALSAMVVFQPRGLRTNMAARFDDDLAITPPLTSTEARLLILRDRQAAIGETELVVRTLSRWFRALIVLTALTVVCAGVNVATDRPRSPEPTHIVIDTSTNGATS